jgi:hypothetical protein
MAVGIRHADHVATFYPQMLALTSPARGVIENIRDKTCRRSPVRLYKCLRLRKLLLVGQKLLYWARTDRGLRYNVCTGIYMLKHLKCKYLYMYWQTTKCCRLLLTIDRPDLSSERAPHKDTTVTVTQQQTYGHENQKGLDIKTYWLTDCQSVVTWLWFWLWPKCNFVRRVDGPTILGSILRSHHPRRTSDVTQNYTSPSIFFLLTIKLAFWLQKREV